MGGVEIGMTNRELITVLQSYPGDCEVVFESYSDLVFPVGDTCQGFFTRHEPDWHYGDFEDEPGNNGEIPAIMLWRKEGPRGGES